MGGTLAVTVRKPDGTEERMARWTNATPWFINNMGLINKDPAHVESYMEPWNDMRRDWLEHEDEYNALVKRYGSPSDVPYEATKDLWDYPMTPCYAGHTMLAPAGYGLTVVDMQKDQILTCQGYTHYGRLHMAGVYLGLTRDGKIPENADDENCAVRLREFHEAKRVTHVELMSPSGWRNMDISDVSFEGLLKLASMPTVSTSTTAAGAFSLDLSPYEVHHYEEANPDSWREFRAKLIDLGFSLTDEEEAAWEETIQEEEEWYEP